MGNDIIVNIIEKVVKKPLEAWKYAVLRMKRGIK